MGAPWAERTLGDMQLRRIACLLAVSAAGCAAATDPAGSEALPPVAARALELAPATNYVATFDLHQLRRDPTGSALAAQRLGWRFWASPAMLLQLDPVRDASMVAVTSLLGPCGPVDSTVVAVPTDPPGVFAKRVDAAIRTWRAQHPPPPGEAADDPAGPALSGWVKVQEGSCTLVQVADYEQTAVTLTADGLLLVHDAPIGNACTPAAKPDLPPELAAATSSTAQALATGWQRGPAGEMPLLAEAMPGAADAAWIGDDVAISAFTLPGEDGQTPDDDLFLGELGRLDRVTRRKDERGLRVDARGSRAEIQRWLEALEVANQTGESF